MLSIRTVGLSSRPLAYPCGMGESKKIKPEWGGRFRHELRATKGSVKKLSVAIGVTTGAIYHWLNGQNEITLSQFLLLCKQGKVDPGRVLLGSGYVPQDIREQITGLAARVIDANPSANPNYAAAEKRFHKTVKR